MTFLKLFFISIFAFPFPVLGHITCLDSQPRREGDPTGQQIANALNKNNGWDNVCSGSFPALSGGGFSNTVTYNHGSLMLKITRASTHTSLSYCKQAFQEIISTCILGGNSWGGSWSGPDPEFSIFNDVWPNNPLVPTDEGGPSEFQIRPGSSPITLGSNNGPITIAPQTAIESGTFSTTTTSIAGLTTNSVTTTTDSHGNPTVIPIWYAGTPDTGIIVVPIVIVGPPGVIPPPSGLPPIIIGPNGEAEPGAESLTSTRTKTTSSEDAGSTIFEYEVPIDEDDLYNFAQVILASERAAKGAAATQSAVPIASPKCTSVSLGAYPTQLATSNGDVSIQELLIRLRQQVCAGPCAAPGGVASSEAGLATDSGNNYCEISVGISKDVEAYMYRGSPAVGVEWQECWDSTMNIINNCVKDKNNVGWWNGDHIYQFYQAGLRPLNDAGAKRTTPITAWLSPPTPDTSRYSCYADCRGFVPNEAWCIANCPCFANEPHVC